MHEFRATTLNFAKQLLPEHDQCVCMCVCGRPGLSNYFPLFLNDNDFFSGYITGLKIDLLKAISNTKPGLILSAENAQK